jgi:hypothetical protein
MAKYIVHNGIRIASDFVPETFGRLTTIGPKFWIWDGIKRPRRCAYQVCECTCGAVIAVRHNSLLTGNTESCGCVAAEKIAQVNKTHGLSRTIEHVTWTGMNKRCRNKLSKEYPNYGGRGIRVCDRWSEPKGMGFTNFLSDMGRRPPECTSIDRIDVNGDYCPENCRWATDKEQRRNKRSSRVFTAFGKTQCQCDWAEELGGSWAAIWQRLRRGWTLEEALSKPINEKYNAKKST